MIDACKETRLAPKPRAGFFAFFGFDDGLNRIGPLEAIVPSSYTTPLRLGRCCAGYGNGQWSPAGADDSPAKRMLATITTRPGIHWIRSKLESLSQFTTCTITAEVLDK